jgi:hypothetical protein
MTVERPILALRPPQYVTMQKMTTSYCHPARPDHTGRIYQTIVDTRRRPC